MIELVLRVALERHWIDSWRYDVEHDDWLITLPGTSKTTVRVYNDAEVKAFCEGLLSAGMVKVEDG